MIFTLPRQIDYRIQPWKFDTRLKDFRVGAKNMQHDIVIINKSGTGFCDRAQKQCRPPAAIAEEGE